MVDTGFWVPEDRADRLAALYGRNSDKSLRLLDDPRPAGCGGRSASVGRRGPAGDGRRLPALRPDAGQSGIARRRPHPGAQDRRPHGQQPPARRGRPAVVHLPGSYGEVGFDGMGFGLTVAVSKGPVATQALGSTGEYLWGGAASTIFWVDPAEALVVVFMTQLIPSGDLRLPRPAQVAGVLVARRLSSAPTPGGSPMPTDSWSVPPASPSPTSTGRPTSTPASRMTVVLMPEASRHGRGHPRPPRQQGGGGRAHAVHRRFRPADEDLPVKLVFYVPDPPAFADAVAAEGLEVVRQPGRSRAGRHGRRLRQGPRRLHDRAHRGLRLRRRRSRGLRWAP